jgi:hypothetical protein
MATRQARYKPVSTSSHDDDSEQAATIEFTSANDDIDDGGDQDDVTTPNEIRRTSLGTDNDSPSSPSSSMLFNSRNVHPMEILSSESYVDDDDDEGDNNKDDDNDYRQRLLTWQDPCTILLILILQVPVLLGNVWLFYNLIGAWFIATPFALHLLIMLVTVRHFVSKQEEQENKSFFALSRMWTSLAGITDISLLGFAYPFVWRILIDNLFTDVDGTVVVEWSGLASQLEVYMILAKAAAILHCLLGINTIGLRMAISCSSAVVAAAALDESSTWTWCGWCFRCLHITFLVPFLHVNDHLEKKMRCFCSVSSHQQTILKQMLVWFVNSVTVLTAVLFMCCLYSSIRHLVTFQPPNKISSPYCDELDDTECWLPFPSFHFLQADSSTETGWRVHLEGKLLPPLKSGMNIHPGFLNELDGFSTMAPMMFYVSGLKEAHQAAAEAKGGGGQLKGWQNIAESTTSQSATLLLEVVSRRLLPHSAEIDYLDDKNPLVLLFPAQPLYHNRHYAVALVNATDERGHRLAPTPGMKKILHGGTATSAFDTNRTSRYLNVLIPALQEAADWFDYSFDPASLQLLFDFHTISEESQLGPVRAVRDAAMQEISSTDWNWNDHVQMIQQIDYENCSSQSNVRLARTVHAELDVPWFLEKHGSGARNSFLDQEAVDSGKAARLGKIKFLVHIPCSVRAAALGEEHNKEAKLSAIMEYGHGLFGTRAEAWDDFLVDMAQKEGFIITAMDWRGMSTFDLLMVVKVLISTPRQFQAVRDNLIQGYACKYALQHFSRHAMLSMEWFRFDDSSDNRDLSRSLQALAHAKPSYVFYGISQGGILGAGYTALSGVTRLIDRAVCWYSV